MIYFLIVLIVILIIIALRCVKLVTQSEVVIVERMGKYSGTYTAGLHLLIPFMDRVRATVSLKEQTMDVPPQNVITKDNVTIRIDTVVFFQITDAKKAVYEIENLQNGIRYLTTTTIRDVVGKMDLDSTFSSREQINLQLRQILDEATDKWGCKVNRVEIKDIEPPKDIRESMEKQMNAERTKRALILQAEGEKQSAITIAEGQKEARILDADADAEAIEKIAAAKAKEIELVYNAIKSSNPDDKLVAIKSLEALEKIADGNANKVFIPFDATKALAGLGSLKEVTKD